MSTDPLAPADPAPRRAATPRPPLGTGTVLFGALCMGLPFLVGVWLLLTPDRNTAIVVPLQHLVVVSVVSLLAVGVAALMARVAVQMEQHRVLLITLGFMSLAGFFSVHAISTPGIGFTGGGGYGTGAGTGYGVPAAGATPSAAPTPYPAAPAAALGHTMQEGDVYDYSGTIVGLSGFLSVASASVLFALGYTTYAEQLGRRMRASTVMAIVAFAIVLYGILAGWQTRLIASIPLSQPPYSYVLGAISVGLLLFAGWRQARVYLRTRFVSHGALTIAFVLLAQAQGLMVLTEFWTLAWWEYHLLMFIATALAIGALYLELGRLRGLERFLPAEVVERVVANDLLRLAGERRVVTVMFADLRGSTTLAERMSAEDVVVMLNAYVGAMGQCVFEQGGMLDKFLGDGLMAVFGVVDDPTHGAAPAARAALQMRHAIARVNADRGSHGFPVVGFGVSVHTGEVIMGSIGIPQRSDFTAIGDTVNTASRLEGLSKEFGVDVVISAESAALLGSLYGPALRPLGSAPVRGRVEPIDIFTLDGTTDGTRTAFATSPEGLARAR